MELHLDSKIRRNAIGTAIQKLAYDSNTALIASPYISGPELQSWTNNLSSVKIICNAHSSGTNPFILENLLKDERFEIHSLRDVHSKVYCFDKSAVVTSANATPNGLGHGLIEAGFETRSEEDLFEVRQWFNDLWAHTECEDVLKFTKATWDHLKAQWSLKNRSSREKAKLSDLILSNSLPDDLVFAFYSEVNDSPQKVKVALVATDAEIEPLPDDISKWDYWIESEDYKSDSKTIDKVLKKYYGHKTINLKVDDWPPKKVYKLESFMSMGIDKAIEYEFRKKKLCLTLYRTDLPKQNFILDKSTVAEIINKSIHKNYHTWKKYLKTIDGQFGYCSVKQLYQLLNYSEG